LIFPRRMVRRNGSKVRPAKPITATIARFIRRRRARTTTTTWQLIEATVSAQRHQLLPAVPEACRAPRQTAGEEQTMHAHA
jgi:hypothetical protein